MAYTRKMHYALRRDHEGKDDTITALLDEIDRLNMEIIVDKLASMDNVTWYPKEEIEKAIKIANGS